MASGKRYSLNMGVSDKYRKTDQRLVPLHPDEIRLSTKSSISNCVGVGLRKLQTGLGDKVFITATGGAIGSAIATVEEIKLVLHGLHQITEIGTVVITDEYIPLEDGLNVVHNDRNVSFIKVTLSKSQLDSEAPGYQCSAIYETDNKEIPVDQQGQQQPLQLQGPHQHPQPLAPQPRASQPRASQPRASQPRASQPQASQPRAPQPRASQPRASQPQAPQPRAPQPRAQEPRAPVPQPRPQPRAQQLQKLQQGFDTHVSVSANLRPVHEVPFALKFGDARSAFREIQGDTPEFQAPKRIVRGRPFRTQDDAVVPWEDRRAGNQYFPNERSYPGTVNQAIRSGTVTDHSIAQMVENERETVSAYLGGGIVANSDQQQHSRHPHDVHTYNSVQYNGNNRNFDEFGSFPLEVQHNHHELYHHGSRYGFYNPYSTREEMIPYRRRRSVSRNRVVNTTSHSDVGSNHTRSRYVNAYGPSIRGVSKDSFLQYRNSATHGSTSAFPHRPDPSYADWTTTATINGSFGKQQQNSTMWKAGSRTVPSRGEVGRRNNLRPAARFAHSRRPLDSTRSSNAVAERFAPLDAAPSSLSFAASRGSPSSLSPLRSRNFGSDNSLASPRRQQGVKGSLPNGMPNTAAIPRSGSLPRIFNEHQHPNLTFQDICGFTPPGLSQFPREAAFGARRRFY